MAFAGVDALLREERRFQIGEEVPKVASQVPGFGRGNNKGKLGHGGHHRMAWGRFDSSGPARAHP